MVKRSMREIERDLSVIRVAAEMSKTWAELALMSGLTVQKVKTTLSSHPIIKRRIEEQLAANKSISKPMNTVEPAKVESNESITIVDTSALMYGLQGCLATPVVCPKFVVNELEKISRNQEEAKNALTAIYSTKNWLTLGPNLYNNEILFEYPEYPIKGRSRGVVALACYYWSNGFKNITIKTRSGEIARLAKLQKIGIIVDFVKEDNISYRLHIVS